MAAYLLTVQYQFIIALVSIGIFAVLCICYLVYYLKTKKGEQERLNIINTMYVDPDYRKADFESIAFDSEAEIILPDGNREGQLTIDDVMNSTVQSKEKEITGNYRKDS